MALCKSGLTSFTLNHGPQQVNNIIFVKHKCMGPKLLAISTLDLLCFAMAHPQGKVLAIQERGQGR